MEQKTFNVNTKFTDVSKLKKGDMIKITKYITEYNPRYFKGTVSQLFNDLKEIVSFTAEVYGVHSIKRNIYENKVPIVYNSVHKYLVSYKSTKPDSSSWTISYNKDGWNFSGDPSRNQVGGLISVINKL